MVSTDIDQALSLQVLRSVVTQMDGTAQVSVPEGMYNVTVQADGYTAEQALLTLMVRVKAVCVCVLVTVLAHGYDAEQALLAIVVRCNPVYVKCYSQSDCCTAEQASLAVMVRVQAVCECSDSVSVRILKSSSAEFNLPEAMDLTSNSLSNCRL